MNVRLDDLGLVIVATNIPTNLPLISPIIYTKKGIRLILSNNKIDHVIDI